MTGFSCQVHDDERLLACHLISETYLQAASGRSGSHPHPQQQRGEPASASSFFTQNSESADLNSSYTKISWQTGALVTAQYDTFLRSVSQSKLNQILASTCKVRLKALGVLAATLLKQSRNPNQRNKKKENWLIRSRHNVASLVQ